MFFDWWRKLVRVDSRVSRRERRKPPLRRRATFKPRAEVLEDRVVPSLAVTLTAPANGSTINNSRPTLSATVTDDPSGGGVASVQFQYSSDGGASWINAGPAETAAPFSYTFASPLPDGTYQVRAVATDNAGRVAASSSGAYSLTTLDAFDGTTNGAYPSGLVEDSSGNLFGTTQLGDGGGDPKLGSGTVFEVAAGSGVVTTLAAFNDANGADPDGGLVLDSKGNLFGTTLGSTNTHGTVFEVAAGSGTVTTLASFNGANGANHGGLVEDSGGDFFGTTAIGGPNGNGTVFELTPSATSFTIDTTGSTSPQANPNNPAPAPPVPGSGDAIIILEQALNHAGEPARFIGQGALGTAANWLDEVGFFGRVIDPVYDFAATGVHRYLDQGLKNRATRLATLSLRRDAGEYAFFVYLAEMDIGIA